MALSEILLVIAALAYLVCGVGIVKVLNAPEAVAPAWLRTVGFVGFAAHAVGVLMNMFAPGAIRFGFGMAVSALLCISVAIVLVESLVHRINGLMGIVIVVSAFGTALPVVFQGELSPAQEWSILFRVHLLMALAAYSFMTIAVVQAILLTRKEREVANPATLNKGGSFVEHAESVGDGTHSFPHRCLWLCLPDLRAASGGDGHLRTAPDLLHIRTQDDSDVVVLDRVCRASGRPLFPRLAQKEGSCLVLGRHRLPGGCLSRVSLHP